MLLLLDIDGTLLLGPPLAHRQALLEALETVYGPSSATTTGPPQIAGSTDRRILRDLLRHAGLEDDAVDAGSRVGRGDVGALRGRRGGAPAAERRPLARETLLGLRDEGHRLGLLTGNVEPIARAKLAQAGLGGCSTAVPGALAPTRSSATCWCPWPAARAGPSPGRRGRPPRRGRRRHA